MRTSKRNSSQVSPSPMKGTNHFDIEEGMSIEKDMAQRSHVREIKITPVKNSSPIQENDEGFLRKAREKYHSTWSDVQQYINKSFQANLDENAHASTVCDLNHFDELPISMKKKLVICDMVRLKFSEETIKEAVNYLEFIPENLTKEQMLKIIAQELTTDHKKELSTSTEHKLELLKTDGDIASLNHLIEDTPAPSHHEQLPIVALPLILTKEPSESLVNLEDQEEPVKVERPTSDGRQEGSPVIQQKRPTSRVIHQTKSQRPACPICFDNFAQYEFEFITKCGHSFCRNCCASHIVEQISTNKVLTIKCPYDGCNHEMTEEQVINLLDQETSEKYTRLKKIALLNQNPNLRWCVRPGCDKYIIGKPGKHKLVCECKMKICFSCGNEYHRFKSCEAVINGVYQKYAKEKHVQACPQCKSRIEKTGGCNHMTCSRCNYQWCWLCGVVYEPEHYTPSNPNHCIKLAEIPGMPLTDNDALESQRQNYCARVCREPSLIIAFPIFLIISSILVPQWFYSERKKKKLKREYNFSTEASSLEVFIFIILGMILLPICLIGFLGVILFDGMVDLYIMICRKVFSKNVIISAPRVVEPQML